MSTFVPKPIAPYSKNQPPQDEASRKIYLDQQLNAIQKSLSMTQQCVTQLQAEMQLIWSALNSLGKTRP